MFILYNTQTGQIARSSSHPITDSMLGYEQAEISSAKIDPDLVIYNAVSQQIQDRPDKNNILQQRTRDLLRKQRNAKLAVTDWTQVPDSPLTVEQRQTWAQYRQSLRDLPESWPDPIPADYRPNWPQKPNN